MLSHCSLPSRVNHNYSYSEESEQCEALKYSFYAIQIRFGTI